MSSRGRPVPASPSSDDEARYATLAPLERLSQLREDAEKKFTREGDSQNFDIEHNIRAIEAILATNAEILDRCMSFGTIAEGSKEDWTVIAARFSLQHVQTFPKEASIQLAVSPKRSEESFDAKPLMQIPREFRDIFTVKKMGGPFAMFVDFEALFQNVLLLHDDVLGPLLSTLKDHLMSIQVCLGTIEEWMAETQVYANILEDVFGQKLELLTGSEIVPSYCSCPNGMHLGWDKCLGCGLPHTNHVIKEFSASGIIKVSLDMEEESERDKLKKFLAFIAVA